MIGGVKQMITLVFYSFSFLLKRTTWAPLWGPPRSLWSALQTVTKRGDRAGWTCSRLLSSRLGKAATLSWAAGSPAPGPHHLGWFYSCLKALLWLPKLYILLQQTQHLGSIEEPYNALYNTNKHDCYKKIRLQNITLCQTPVDCNFKFWLSKEPERF